MPTASAVGKVLPCMEGCPVGTCTVSRRLGLESRRTPWGENCQERCAESQTWHQRWAHGKEGVGCVLWYVFAVDACVLSESLMVRPVGGVATYRMDWYGGFGSRSVPLRYGDRGMQPPSPFLGTASRYRGRLSR